jgi:hypothetical protein
MEGPLNVLTCDEEIVASRGFSFMMPSTYYVRQPQAIFWSIL